jgi:hypothetical protein
MLSTEDAAKMIGRSPATLRSWRCSKIGPPFTRLHPRSVVYDEGDIHKYVAERRFVPSVRATEVNRHAALQAAS